MKTMTQKEYIKRTEALRYIEWYILMKEKNYGNPTVTLDEVAGLLTEVVAADVVEVVRCKDCEYSSFVKSCSKYACQKSRGALKYCNDFCSCGKRKID